MDDRKRRRKSYFDIISTVMLVAALGVFLFSGYKLYTTWREYHTGTSTYRDLANLFPTLPASETEGGGRENEGNDIGEDHGLLSEKSDISLNEREAEDSRDWEAFYQEMKALNPDYMGWIIIEDTSINYPIVQAEDNDYYLHRLFDGTENFSGTLFIDFRCEDCFGKGNTIVYGHNMKNGSMFAGLLNYRKNEFYQNHKTFSVYTEDGEVMYEIFAIYTTSPDSDTYDVWFADSEEYAQWLQSMYSQSVVRPEIVLDEQTSVITLSTCVNNSVDRLVIQAKRIN